MDPILFLLLMVLAGLVALGVIGWLSNRADRGEEQERKAN